MRLQKLDKICCIPIHVSNFRRITTSRNIHNVPFEILVDADSRSLEGVELGHLPRIGLGQEGVGANQPLEDGGEDTDDALALGDLLLGRLHLVDS